MAAIPAAARESTPTEVRRRISKTGSTGSARDAPEERPPVNKRMKLASPVTSRGDEDVPLFMGDWRGSGGAVSATAPAPVATMTSGKATQTAQRSARYLGTCKITYSLLRFNIGNKLFIFYGCRKKIHNSFTTGLCVPSNFEFG